MAMDRRKVKWIRLDEVPEEERVAGSIGERLAMVWPLTVDALAFAGRFDAESRLRRHVVRVRRP